MEDCFECHNTTGWNYIVNVGFAPQVAVDSAKALLNGLGCASATVALLHVGEEGSMPGA